MAKTCIEQGGEREGRAEEGGGKMDKGGMAEEMLTTSAATLSLLHTWHAMNLSDQTDARDPQPTTTPLARINMSRLLPLTPNFVYTTNK